MLTSAQKKAVQTIDRNILVSAGAGTGKTRVLVERILYLLRSQKVAITELLILTFTEKAANEIKTRLSKNFRDSGLERPRRDLEKAAISTFHSFASRLLKEHPVEAGVDPDFRVIETEQSELLKEESLQEVLEKSYEEKSDIFELLAVYGEGTVKDGILKVFSAARHEGKKLQDFFLDNSKRREAACVQKEQTLQGEAQHWIRKLEEIDAKGWETFLNNKNWNWDTVQDFEAWRVHYKGKRKAGWKEWRGLLDVLMALRVTPLAMPWQEKFERMALAFETVYGTKKKEKGFLDFDDLQMKAVGLFRGDTPAIQKLRERYQKLFKYILIDEFQDTNFLQMEFVELLSSSRNLFMVGDYKQSIYGFRGAEPRIFLEKEELYKNGEQGERIFLSESFRSEPPVLDFANRFFKSLWEEDGFPFESLTSAKETAVSTKPQRPVVEILITEQKEDEDMRYARLREARALAARFRELHEQEKISYGDMAVLFQAMTLSGIYEDAFKSEGIPYFIVAGRGFYEQPEIQDMMCFLTHLEKPLADIPLAATLRSPFFHITDDTLFWLSRHVKTRDEETPLYQAIKETEKISEISAEQKKRLVFFSEIMREFRELKDRISLSEFISRILERTGYELSVLMGSAGVRRFANLKKLVALVREYETYERMSLASFLNILKRLQTQQVREAEAQIVLETGAEAVRMMSVHAAKGLEFPVVCVADMGHRGSHADSKTVIAHASDGYGIQVRDEVTLTMREPYFFQWVDKKIKKREEEEWKRLFYVAVTRAKSRIFLSGVHKKKKETKDHFRDMGSWMEWAMNLCEELDVKITQNDAVMAVLSERRPVAEKEDIGRILEKISARAKKKGPKELSFDEGPAAPPLPKTIDLPVSAYVLFQKNPQEYWRTYQIGWTVLVQDSSEGLTRTAPISAAQKLISVGTVLVQDSSEGLTRTAPISAAQKLISVGTVGENEMSGENAGFEDADVSPADFGTAMHQLFEYLDFKKLERYSAGDLAEKFFGAFGKRGVEEARELIKASLGHSVFRRLQKARQIKREIDFVLNERHGLIQGKLDVLFEDEKGEWHILDYKTATGDEKTTRQSGYDLQLEIYALAAQRILKIPVRSGILFYLKNQTEVVLPFSEAEGNRRESFFDELEKKICGLQKQILDFSNTKIVR